MYGRSKVAGVGKSARHLKNLALAFRNNLLRFFCFSFGEIVCEYVFLNGDRGEIVYNRGII